MQESNNILIPMQHGLEVWKAQSPKMTDELERMNWIPYSSDLGSIMYVVYVLYMMSCVPWAWEVSIKLIFEKPTGW